MARLLNAGFRTRPRVYFKEGHVTYSLRACEGGLSKKILEVMAGMTKLPGPPFRSRASLHFRDVRGNLRGCEQDASKKILEAMACGDSIGIVTFENEVHRTRNFKYDLERMKLISLTTEEKEDIFIEYPWDPKSLISITGDGGKELKRQLLMMALERIRTGASLTKIMRIMKRVSRFVIRENPYLFSGHPPYEKFVESLYNYFEEKTRSHRDILQPTLLEKFLDCASDDATSDTFASIERENIRILFHDTDPAVMHAMLFSGLQPKYRQFPTWKDRDFFNLRHDVSFRYARSKILTSDPTLQLIGTKLKALLFMVINPFESHSTSGTDDIEDDVYVESNECELALAEVTDLRETIGNLSGTE